TDISEQLLDACLTEFYRLREGGFEKPPATAELLDWIGALRSSGEDGGPGGGSSLRHVGTLLKRSQDLLKFKGIKQKTQWR
ncbi:MAG: MoxR family ATPase, partial [Deltaproteobacteria bacterium]|nr:MoxR family ATPase [Deltaproteobacteria bacterium]